MLTLPRPRLWLFPASVLLIFVLFYRSIVRVPASVKNIIHFRSTPQIQYGIRIPQEIIDEHFMPLRDPSQGHLWPDQKYYYKYSREDTDRTGPFLGPLLQCRRKPNPHTNHIRLPNIIQNVSQLTSSENSATKEHFNPTILALPPWSPHQYLLVSRVATEGLHQENLICEADTCYCTSRNSSEGEVRRPREKDCTSEDLTILGAAGGLRCATPPRIISIPPTPAEKCEGTWAYFPDIPGFHDPRIFWSGKGEPLIMVNSASRYACVGLWITDLRTLHEPLKELLASQPGQPYHPGPLMSYPSLTELTRNPASTRASVEKNWFMFFPTASQAFLHYDLSIPRLQEGTDRTIGGRTFAQVIGNGFTTPNLTDPEEKPCLPDEPDAKGRIGHWHQATNSLKLIICHRRHAEKGLCNEEQEGRTVHFAVMHRKFSNDLDLPLRYERFFVVWDARPPFRIRAMSKYPILMWNETASGWSAEENWVESTTEDEEGDQNTNPAHHESPVIGGDGERNLKKRTWNNSTTINLTSASSPNPPKSPPLAPFPFPSPLRPQNQTQNQTHHHDEEYQNWAYFTYTPSISWSFRPSPAIPLREHENPETSDPIKRSNPMLPDSSEHERTLQALNVGYLDDEVILGIGIDDRGQGFARVRAEELLGCLRVCEK